MPSTNTFVNFPRKFQCYFVAIPFMLITSIDLFSSNYLFYLASCLACHRDA